jgi:hypothetical protein|tara:strand:+ start:849 stop:1127 length:279 start_codon:yes stop_codon:yes gene_type:complete
MTHNDLKKGTKVQLTSVPMISNAYRTGTLMDSMKGLTRMVKIDEANGYFPDIGSVYVSEILYVLYPDDIPEEVTISEAHQKKLKTLQAIHWG